MANQPVATVANLKLGEDFDVFIGRPSKWGNPYSHLPGTRASSRVASREQAISSYRDYILGSPTLMRALPELCGKRLGCFCAPLSCHGDVLAELANSIGDSGVVPHPVKLKEAIYK